MAQTPVNYKIAFIGDSEHGQDFQNVLDLIAAEGTDAVVHAGDLAYSQSNVNEFKSRIENTLGTNFPYFASAGNHDDDHWSDYQAFLEPWASANGIVWDGNYGLQSSFEYQGIHFVLMAPGDFSGDHASYIRDKHATSDAIWKLSVWHRNMTIMQLGGKDDDTGWGVYEESRKAGAIIVTAHEHSYHRTFELSSTQNATVSHFNDDQANPINLTPDDIGTTGTDEGRSFVFVSGLGGKSIRDQDRCTSGVGPGATGDCQIWAAVYTSDQDANHGALFGEFNVNGDETLAHFYFKDIDGNIADDFWVRSNDMPPSPPADPTNLVATAISSSRIDLSWTDHADNESGFKIEQSTDGGLSFTEIASVGVDVTDYSDTGLAALTEYCYRVRAFNVAGNSGYSNSDCATTPDAPTGPPLVFRVERPTGNVFAEGSFISGGADLAERIDVSEPVEPGDVVELDPDKPGYYRKTSGSSQLIAGVITTEPGFKLGNNPEEMESEQVAAKGDPELEAESRPLLALMGRVPVKATTQSGAIRPGALLTVSSKRGYAMLCNEAAECDGAIIGKALEGLASGEGLILVLVMLH